MQGYRGNIEEATLQNNDYRRVLYTGAHEQLVLMNLRPGEEIGNEVHDVDQFIRVEAGTGRAIINNDDEQEVLGGWALLVPAGTWHNVVNTGEADLKLYTVYGPPNHKDGTVQPTKADEAEEHFDGQTSE